MTLNTNLLASSQVDTANLERVRKVKTRHQRLFTRVTTVREELQRFLEDDDDMAKMCLTRKKELEQAASATGVYGFVYLRVFGIQFAGCLGASVSVLQEVA